MKKISLALAAGLGLALTTVSPALPANAAIPSNAAVFFSPHQDDETLMMGAAIHEHVLAGRPTYVVLLTGGQSSGLCSVKFPSSDPAITAKKCTAFRDAEFKKAVTALGATPIIPTNRQVDGKSTVAGMSAIIKPYATVGRSLKTYSWQFDTHVDHRNAGQALRNLYFKDSRYYMKPEAVAQRAAYGQINYKHPYHTDAKCKAAVEAYRYFGWQSVSSFFDIAKKGLLSQYHTP